MESLRRTAVTSTVLLALLGAPAASADSANEEARDGARADTASGDTASVSASSDSPPSGPASNNEPPNTSGGAGADPCAYSTISDPGKGGPSGAKPFEHVLEAITDAEQKKGLPDWDKGTYVVVSCPGQPNRGYYQLPGEGGLPSAAELALQATQSVTVTTPPVNFNPDWTLEDGRRATLKNAETRVRGRPWRSKSRTSKGGAAYIDAWLPWGREIDELRSVATAGRGRMRAGGLSRGV